MTRLRILAAVILAALFWAGARGIGEAAHQDRETWPKTAGTVMVPPVEVARFAGAVVGREMLADVTWARTLVYFGSNWAGQGDLSQLEQLFDVTIALAPRFKPVYEFAASAVTYKGGGGATQEEFQTSLRYLERAMAEFPEDYEYFWTAGMLCYHDLWSEDEEVRRGYRERGANLIEEAMRKPNAPGSLAQTAANMRSRLGQQQRAIDNLRDMVLITEDQDELQKLIERIRTDDPALAEEVERARLDLDEAWQRDMPAVDLDFYILLGPPPSSVIDFRDLATPHDLIGATEAAPSPPTPVPAPVSVPVPVPVSDPDPDPDPGPDPE